MKIHKIVYCLMNYEKSSDIAMYGVNLFGNMEEAQEAMEVACKRKYESVQAGTLQVDTFAACVVTPENAWAWSILAREIEVEVPDSEPIQKMWTLTDEIDGSSVLLGVYTTKTDAYNAMCEDFKRECDAVLGRTPFDAGIGEESATFEPEYGACHYWAIEPITPATGGTGK